MAKPDSIFGNIWTPFGLRSDPFFQDELRTDPASDFPARLLFVGREEQLRRIGRRIGGSETSRTIVEGQAGVGKTSFVNRVKSELAQSGAYMMHEQPIRITSDSTPDSFLADVLRVLVRLFTVSGGIRDEFWNHVAYLVESRIISSGGVNLGPVGVQYQQQRVNAEVAHEPLIEGIPEALRRLRATGGNGIVLHVNNLENLGLADTERASILVQNVRDVFLQPGAHWLVVGSTGVERAVFRRTDQVGGIFPEATRLDPLSSGDVAQMLELRYRHLRPKHGAGGSPPVEPATAAGLYDLYRGDLRNFLRLLSDAANLILGVEGTRPLSAEQILASAGNEYRTRILSGIGRQDFEHLAAVMRKAGPGGLRVTEVAAWAGVSQASASGIVGRLESAGLIREDRREGKSVYYQPTGAAAVAFTPVRA